MPVTEKAMHDAANRHSADRRMVMEMAIAILDLKRKMYQDHEDDVSRWYRHRHINEGHSYPACIHGASNWTDYDNICGPCENGYTYFDYLRDARESLDEAQNRWTKYWEAQHHYIWMISNGYDAEKAGQFSQWAHNKWLVVR